jgi:hypothetical protein
MGHSRRYEHRSTVYSDWHYGLDYKMIAIDVDMIMLEIDYEGNQARPVALIEAKHENERWFANSVQIRGFVNLANAAGIPAWVVAYSNPIERFTVYPLNDQACKFFAVDGPLAIPMTEKEYTKVLEEVRRYGRK